MTWPQIAHSVCNRLVTKRSDFIEIHQSLICGAPLSSSVLKLQLENSALIHLFVVSGSHLLAIDWALQKACPFRSAFRLFFATSLLILYSMASLFNPPVTRALIGLQMSLLSKTLKWQTSSLHLTFLTGVTTLLLVPQWWRSLSFCLSWFASFALSLLRDFKIENTFVKSGVLIAWMSFPLGAQCPHPIMIIFNVVMTLFFSMLVFPTSVLGVLLPTMMPLADKVLALFLWTLKTFSPEIPSQSKVLPESQELPRLWLFLFCAHGLALIILILKQRWTLSQQFEVEKK